MRIQNAEFIIYILKYHFIFSKAQSLDGFLNEERLFFFLEKTEKGYRPNSVLSSDITGSWKYKCTTNSLNFTMQKELGWYLF